MMVKTSCSPLKFKKIKTPIGAMLAVGNDSHLYALQFADASGFLKAFKIRCKRDIVPGESATLISIEKELQCYFEGKLKKFRTPIHMLGTPFQKKVWSELFNIPFGSALSYSQVAALIKMPTAVRALGGANGKNPLAVIVPCHRVVGSDGRLGGYNGGIERKIKLLSLEGVKKYD